MQIISLLVITLAGCSTKPHVQNFTIDITHFYGAEGYTLHYILNKDSVSLQYNCDYEGCKDTLVYKEKLNPDSVSIFYEYLLNMKYSSLENHYENDGCDGRYTTIQISGKNIPTKKIEIVRYHQNEIDTFLHNFDRLIPNKKYRLFKRS